MKIAVVIPAYKVKRHILGVIEGIGPEVSAIYIVDDGCPEQTGKHVEQECHDPRVKTLYNPVNKGVGGATKHGYLAALNEGFDIVVKVDGDGQMDTSLIPLFVKPLVDRRADYTKGNRFYSYEHINKMPGIRLFGNAVLSFMTKISSGYWNITDPTNGFTAIHRSALAQLPLEKVCDSYFFESDMLFRLNTVRAVVQDIPHQAVYEDEISGLKIRKIIGPFLKGHASNLCKRILYCYFIRDFSIASLEFVVGLLMLLFALVYGGVNWANSIATGEQAAGGVIMLSAVTVILGVQFLLSAINYDMQNIPRQTLSSYGEGISSPPEQS